MRWNPDGIIPRAGGAVGLAAVYSYLQSRTTPMTTALTNGDLLSWAVVAADLLTVAPDNTTAGRALDAAADAAMFSLANNLFTSRFSFSSINPLAGLGGVLVATPVTPAAAAATGQPSPNTQVVPATTPVPAASMSAVGDVALAGY